MNYKNEQVDDSAPVVIYHSSFELHFNDGASAGFGERPGRTLAIIKELMRDVREREGVVVLSKERLCYAQGVIVHSVTWRVQKKH